MKVLIATEETQGTVPGDFNFTNVGELVHLPIFTCDSAKGDPDHSCGCTRAFEGFVSLKAGTTAKVVEHAVTLAQYIVELESSLKATGFLEIGGPSLVMRVAQEVFDTVKHFEPGEVIGNRGRAGIVTRN